MFNTLFRFSDPNLPFRSSLLFSPKSDLETCISYELNINTFNLVSEIVDWNVFSEWFSPAF